MKVVIDTNVLISGLFSSQSPPVKVLNLWLVNKLDVYVSPEIIEEYMSVLLRPKFSRIGSAKERYEMISALIDLENSYMVYPDFNLHVVREDPDDDIFLECALQGRVEAIISGDEHLLEIGFFKGIHILSPFEFLRRYF